MPTLKLRSRIQREHNPGNPLVMEETVAWEPGGTAVLICDMWDKHWCKAAEMRVSEMAPRMNALVSEMRRRGSLIVHSPSDTMEFYANHPGRLLALNSLISETVKEPLLKEFQEPALPIDDSDGGCPCDPPCRTHYPWTRQIETLEIHDGDAIGDGPEVFSLLQKKEIQWVMMMGVHTNMCVVGRPFGLRNMVQRGHTVALVRDMTDAMYNPRMPPFVDHFSGTDLVVAHIERYLCPTLTSDQILGGEPFRFAEDTR